MDGDGIAYRTIPGDGLPVYFTRGSGHNAKGQYSERPDDYVDNVDRLSRKFDTARKFVPKPVVQSHPTAKIGFVGYGRIAQLVAAGLVKDLPGLYHLDREALAAL